MSEVQETGTRRKLTPNRFRITSIVIATVMLMGAFGMLIGPFIVNVSAVPDTHTWDGGGADAFAGTHANWVSDIAPEAGDSVIFDSGALPSTWNLSITLNAFSMNVGYSGVVTVAASTNWGTTGDVILSDGTLTGNTVSSTLTCGGNFTESGSRITAGTLRLTMSGTGKILSLTTYNALRYFDVSGSVTFTSAIGFQPDTGMTIEAGGHFTFDGTLLYSIRPAHTWSNLGIMDGTGTLNVRATVSTTTSFGVINSPVALYYADTTSTLTLTSNAVLGSTLSISSASANTFTLNISTYDLSATTITLGSNGALQGTGTIICSADFVQSGINSVFTQGGDLYAHDIILSKGIFTGINTKTIYSSGDFTQTGTTITTQTVNLTMTGTGVALFLSTYNALYGLTVTGYSTYSNRSAAFQPEKGGLTVGVGATWVFNGSIYYALQSSLYTWSNSGTITGAGTIQFRLLANKSFSFGVINCPVWLYYADSNYVMTLTSDAIFGSTFKLSSGSASTFTLDLSTSNFALSATDITIGTRGVLNARASTISCSQWNSSDGTFLEGTSNVIIGGPRVSFGSPSTILANTGYHIGDAMIKAPNGDYLGFIRYGTSHVSHGDYAVMKLIRSTDQGATWGSGTTILSVPDRDVRNYASVVSSTGRIFVFLSILDTDNLTGPNDEPAHDFHYMYSDDNGVSWSSAIDIPDPTIDGLTPLGSTPYSAQVLGANRIAVTIDAGNATHSQVRLAYSDDNGVTWNQVGITNVTTISILWRTEMSIVYAGNNQVIGMVRVESTPGVTVGAWMYSSTDNGITWTDRGFGFAEIGGVRTPQLITFSDKNGAIWVVGIMVYNSLHFSIASADNLMVNGINGWPISTYVGAIYGRYISSIFEPSNGAWLIMADEHISESRSDILLWRILYQSVTLNQSQQFHNLEINETNVVVKVATGGSIKIADNLSVNLDSTHSLFIASPTINSIRISIISPTSWIAKITPSISSIIFTLSGLESGGGILYNVYVDGNRIEQLRADGSGTISFTYSGPWSEHTFEVVKYDPWGPLYDMGPVMLYIGVTVGLIAIVLVMVGSRIRRR